MNPTPPKGSANTTEEEVEGIPIQGLHAVKDEEPNPVSSAVKEALEVDEDYVPTRQYINRDLNNGDVYKFGRVIAIVLNHPTLKASYNAALNGTSDANQVERWMDVASNAVALLFIHASRELQLFLAHVAGIERDFDEAKMREVTLAKGENRDELSEGEIINRLNNEILHEFSLLPITATTDIITELVDRPDFGPLYKSGKLAARSMGKIFTRLQTNT